MPEWSNRNILYHVPQGSIDGIVGMLHMVEELMLQHLDLYGMNIKVQIKRTKNWVVADNRKKYDKYKRRLSCRVLSQLYFYGEWKLMDGRWLCSI